MISGGGKNKGSNWERVICRELSLWLSNGERKDLFWRSAMSGGRATIYLKEGTKLRSQSGDISAITGLGEKLINSFMIEAKFYTDLQMIQSLLKDNGNLYKFWHLLVGDAEKFGKYPMLIAKQNNMPAFCLLSWNALDIFGLKEYSNVSLIRWGCGIVLFDVFLEQAKLEDNVVYVETPKPKRVKL